MNINFIGKKPMNDLVTLWAMYREIPGWLWICKAIGADEKGLRQLEEMDNDYIHFHRKDQEEYEKEVNTRFQDLISETPKEYRNDRRKEYLTSLITELPRKIETIHKDYEESLRNDETYDNRAVLAYGKERLEKVKSRYEAELRALKGNGDTTHFENKLLLAKQRKFSEFLEIKKGKALCPFHDDHDPSFSVNGNRAYCFGCGWRGDVVDFVIALKGFSFKEALEFLTQQVKE